MPRVLLLSLVLLCHPCAAEEPIRVLATTQDLVALAKVVGGDRIDAAVLRSPRELKGASLLVRIGAGSDAWVDRMKRPKGLEVVDASKGVRLLHGSPRYWLDPHNAQPITASILAALVRASPADEALFQANRDAFLSQLNEQIFRWERKLAPLAGTKVVALRGGWTYFGERFGLRVAGPARAERGEEAGVRLIIAEPDSDPARVARLAKKTGARVVTLLATGPDYTALFDEDVRRLAAE